ncbi:MAG: hypothetical protein JXR27_00600 [Paludibacteraceae bacterium]|nr:hypothetical protein [Paludibacteraceae bacterium]
MAINSTKYNHFLLGLIPGLLLPALFIWVYLERFYPVDLSLIEMLRQLYPGPLIGKLLMLSTMPDLILVFIFYKSDSFKIASGFMISAMPYLIGSFAMI